MALQQLSHWTTFKKDYSISFAYAPASFFKMWCWINIHETYINLLFKISKNQSQIFIANLSSVTRMNTFAGENIMSFHRKNKLTLAPLMFLGSFLVRFSAKATISSSIFLYNLYHMFWNGIKKYKKWRQKNFQI